MKKKIYLFVILGLSLLMGGCFKNSKLDKAEILSTVYPIEYVVNRLYGYNSTISSIYPNDTNPSEYKLTNKQVKGYAKKADLFVYIGLTDEKDIAKTLLNKNKNLQIMDSTYGIKYNYGIHELWLNPSSYLTLANTIKNDLEELIDNKYISQDIENNYDNLEEELSLLDAELRSIGRSAKKSNTNTILIANDSLGFLTEYGFNVINVSNESNMTSNMKNKFKDKTYSYVLVSDEEKTPDHIKDLVDNYGTKLIEINMMSTLTDSERQSNEDYLNIMNSFMSTISNLVLK